MPSPPRLVSSDARRIASHADAKFGPAGLQNSPRAVELEPLIAVSGSLIACAQGDDVGGEAFDHGGIHWPDVRMRFGGISQVSLAPSRHNVQ